MEKTDIGRRNIKYLQYVVEIFTKLMYNNNIVT